MVYGLEGGRQRKGGGDREALRIEAGTEAKKEAGRFRVKRGHRCRDECAGKETRRQTETYRQTDADRER